MAVDPALVVLPTLITTCGLHSYVDPARAVNIQISGILRNLSGGPNLPEGSRLCYEPSDVQKAISSWLTAIAPDAQFEDPSTWNCTSKSQLSGSTVEGHNFVASTWTVSFAVSCKLLFAIGMRGGLPSAAKFLTLSAPDPITKRYELIQGTPAIGVERYTTKSRGAYVLSLLVKTGQHDPAVTELAGVPAHEKLQWAVNSAVSTLITEAIGTMPVVRAAATEEEKGALETALAQWFAAYEHAALEYAPLRALDIFAESSEGQKVTALYFGSGQPSYFSPAYLPAEIWVGASTRLDVLSPSTPAGVTNFCLGVSLNTLSANHPSIGLRLLMAIQRLANTAHEALIKAGKVPAGTPPLTITFVSQHQDAVQLMSDNSITHPHLTATRLAPDGKHVITRQFRDQAAMRLASECLQVMAGKTVQSIRAAHPMQPEPSIVFVSLASREDLIVTIAGSALDPESVGFTAVPMGDSDDWSKAGLKHSPRLHLHLPGFVHGLQSEQFGACLPISPAAPQIGQPISRHAVRCHPPGYDDNSVGMYTAFAAIRALSMRSSSPGMSTATMLEMAGTAATWRGLVVAGCNIAAKALVLLPSQYMYTPAVGSMQGLPEQGAAGAAPAAAPGGGMMNAAALLATALGDDEGAAEEAQQAMHVHPPPGFGPRAGMGMPPMGPPSMGPPRGPQGYDSGHGARGGTGKDSGAHRRSGGQQQQGGYRQAGGSSQQRQGGHGSHRSLPTSRRPSYDGQAWGASPAYTGQGGAGAYATAAAMAPATAAAAPGSAPQQPAAGSAAGGADLMHVDQHGAAVQAGAMHVPTPTGGVGPSNQQPSAAGGSGTAGAAGPSGAAPHMLQNPVYDPNEGRASPEKNGSTPQRARLSGPNEAGPSNVALNLAPAMHAAAGHSDGATEDGDQQTTPMED